MRQQTFYDAPPQPGTSWKKLLEARSTTWNRPMEHEVRNFGMSITVPPHDTTEIKVTSRLTGGGVHLPDSDAVCTIRDIRPVNAPARRLTLTPPAQGWVLRFSRPKPADPFGLPGWLLTRNKGGMAERVLRGDIPNKLLMVGPNDDFGVNLEVKDSRLNTAVQAARFPASDALLNHLIGLVQSMAAAASQNVQ